MPSRQLHPRRSRTRRSSSLSRLRERARERALLLLRAFVPLLISAFFVRIGSALLGGFLLAVAPKGTKRACPAIRPSASLRVRSLHRRSRDTPRRAIPGPSRLSRHPCRSTPSTTIPLTLLKGRLVLPDSSTSWHAKRGGDQCAQRREKPPGNSEPESPSGGRVEVLRRGTSRRDAARGVKGHGWPLYAGPRSGTGRREVWRRSRQTRMSGWPSLWLLSLGQTRESDSP